MRRHAYWSDEPHVFSSFPGFSFWEILLSCLSLNCLVHSSYKAEQFQLFVACTFWEKFLSRLSLNCLVCSSYNAELFQLFIECVFLKKMSPWSLELELSRSLKLECWAIPALCQFPFFGKNSTLITWVGAVIFAGKRAKSLGFFNISMRLLIALCLNCLAVIADLWFRFLKEVSFQYWTYMTKNKNSDLRHGFNHPVWTPSFFLIDRCSTNHITNIS